MRSPKCVLVTGGAGFIGSAFVRFLMQSREFLGRVVTLDAFTYASDLSLLEGLDEQRHRVVRGSICDQALVEQICIEEQIDTIVHFAAETHVDRSIVTAAPFFETNVLGTLALLEVVRIFPYVHFHHVSTDEVYGSLGQQGHFTECSPYRPSSPYAASKAASDHVVRAFAHTYQLSTTLSHCCNNYGPGQMSEKYVPLIIMNALAKKTIPIYGTGQNVRDWLYVDDHVRAVWHIVQNGTRSESYGIGAHQELTNLALLNKLLSIIAEEIEEPVHCLHELIQFVPDRPGHDFRYAIDSNKIKAELGWRPIVPLMDGLQRTVRWYCARRISV
jgi:dTDP-glucose 4,6-dehydratase